MAEWLKRATLALVSQLRCLDKPVQAAVSGRHGTLGSGVTSRKTHKRPFTRVRRTRDIQNCDASTNTSVRRGCAFGKH